MGDIFTTPKPVNADWSEAAHHLLPSAYLILGWRKRLVRSRQSNFCKEKAKQCEADCGVIASLKKSQKNLWKRIEGGEYECNI